jgi:hypothetical protein
MTGQSEHRALGSQIDQGKRVTHMLVLVAAVTPILEPQLPCSTGAPALQTTTAEDGAAVFAPECHSEDSQFEPGAPVIRCSSNAQDWLVSLRTCRVLPASLVFPVAGSSQSAIATRGSWAVRDANGVLATVVPHFIEPYTRPRPDCDSTTQLQR